MVFADTHVAFQHPEGTAIARILHCSEILAHKHHFSCYALLAGSKFVKVHTAGYWSSKFIPARPVLLV
jgi:hypothetical protein